MNAPLRTSHHDLAAPKLGTTDRSDLSVDGPSLRLALADLIGGGVILFASTATEQVDYSILQSFMQLLFGRACIPQFSNDDRAGLTLSRPHLRDADLGSERGRQDLGPRLTARQHQVLTLVAEGSTNAQIARRLSISASTVRKHLENAYRILGVTNRIAAISTLPTHRTEQSAAFSASAERGGG